MTDKSFTLSLGPLESGHAEGIRAWRNDYRIWQFTRQNDYLDDFEQGDWFRRQSSDPTIKMYSVTLSDGETAKLVGVAGFTSIDYRNSRAEFSLYLAPAYQRQGLGRKALELLLGHGFDNHGFRLIYGETFSGNPAARLFESLGFVHEGIRRGFYFKAGRAIDADLYSMLRTEWLAHDRNANHSDARPDGDSSGELPAARLPGAPELQ